MTTTRRRIKPKPKRRSRRHLKRQVYYVIFFLLFIIYQLTSEVHILTNLSSYYQTDTVETMYATIPTVPVPSPPSSASSVADNERSDTGADLAFAEFVSKDSMKQKQPEQGQEQQTSPSSSILIASNMGGEKHNNIPTSIQEAMIGRESLVSMLIEAGIVNMTESEIRLLPTKKQIHKLYGPKSNKNKNQDKNDDDDGGGDDGDDKPVIIGLETCEEFRNKVPLHRRFMGIAGMFNSGTTAFAKALQANCRYPNRTISGRDYPTSGVNGMFDQVPWAKHKWARDKYNVTVYPKVPKDDVLPIVLVRDPYYWMQSMCRQGYGTRWDHNPDRHCPNLVPNEYDRKRFKRLKTSTSVPVWMGQGQPPKNNNNIDNNNNNINMHQNYVVWDSLIHLWNDWYESYVYEADFPRLIIRFEDTLYHPKEVMKLVCQCGGAQQQPLPIMNYRYNQRANGVGDNNIYNNNQDDNGSSTTGSQYQYLLGEAKGSHKHVQNNMISAIIKYGTDVNRYRNMTRQDIQFTEQHVNDELITMFQYQRASSSL